MKLRNAVTIVALTVCLPALSACAVLIENPLEMTPSPTPGASSSETPGTPTPATTPTAPADSFIYTNDEFGFDLTFPLAWQGLTVKTDEFGSGAVHAMASVGGTATPADGARVSIFSPEFAGNPDIQPVVIVIFHRADWDTFDDVVINGQPAGKNVQAAAGGSNYMTALDMNSTYVFTEGTREYGFAYMTGVDQALAIAETLTALDR